jgi:hypothetical protein
MFEESLSGIVVSVRGVSGELSLRGNQVEIESNHGLMGLADGVIRYRD